MWGFAPLDFIPFIDIYVSHTILRSTGHKIFDAHYDVHFFFHVISEKKKSCSPPWPLPGEVVKKLDRWMDPKQIKKCNIKLSINATAIMIFCIVLPPFSSSYVCDCEGTGFVGDHCEEDILECASDPCQHGATCSEGTNQYHCLCWTGTSWVTFKQGHHGLG